MGTASSDRATHSRRVVMDWSDFEPNDRFDAWQSAVNDSFVPVATECPDPDSWRHLRGNLISQALGQATVGRVTGAPARIVRSTPQIAQSDPGSIYLNLQLRGSSVITQGGREARLRPGDFSLCDTRYPYAVAFAEPHSMFVVTLTPEALRVRPRALSDLTATRFSGRRGLGSIASTFLGAVSGQLERGPLRQTVLLSDAILDVVGAAVADRVQTIHVEDAHTYAHILRLRVESYIAQRISDPALSVSSVAAAHNMSVRYLQKLFADHEQGLYSLIRHRRLEGSRRDLASPSVNATVASIGAKWGMTSAASFSRAFRQYYGLTPSEYRAQAVQAA